MNEEMKNFHLPNYRFIRHLGSGGDGSVYLTEHIPTEQLRAAKLLKRENRSQIRELEMMKHLKHRSLPRIYDVLEADGKVWLIMEYIEGKPLKSCARENISVKQIYEVAERLCEILLYLHSREPAILHLDIKPSNILIDEEGNTVLIDFGAAIQSGQDRKKACYGTPGFAAPELLKRDRKIDERCDIYSWGATISYLLDRAPPGEKKAAGGLMLLVEDCLQENPEDRIWDAGSLLKEIRKTRAASSLVPRSPRLIPAAAILLLGLTAVFIGFGIFRSADKTGNDAISYDELMKITASEEWEKSMNSYRELAGKYPEDSSWLLQLMDQLEADETFSIYEEDGLRELLYMTVPKENTIVADQEAGETEILTVLDCQMQSNEFPEFAWRMGIDYWYMYEGNGGRARAKNWFDIAAERGTYMRPTPDWLSSAGVYSRMCLYYEKIGQPDEAGALEANYDIFWQDLTELWDSRGETQMAESVFKELILESLNCLAMGAGQISEDEKEKTEEILQNIEELLESEDFWNSPEELNETQKAYDMAMESWNRVWHTETEYDSDDEREYHDADDSEYSSDNDERKYPSEEEENDPDEEEYNELHWDPDEDWPEEWLNYETETEGEDIYELYEEYMAEVKQEFGVE